MNTSLKIKLTNKILLTAVALSVGFQFFLVFLGIYETEILLLATQLSVLLVPVIGLKISGVSLKKELHLKPIKFRTFLFAFLIVLCAYPIVSLLNMISMLFVDNAVAGVSVDMYTHGYLFSMLMMAVFPAIGEELLVRGVVYRGYRRRSPLLAWLLSAFIFGMLHMNFNQMPYAIFLGLMMVIMNEAADSLRVSMWIHFFMNGISTTVGYFSQELLKSQMERGYTLDAIAGPEISPMGMISSMVPLAAIMLVLIFFIIAGTFRVNGRQFSDMFQKESETAETEKKERIGDIWFFLALLIMILITVWNTVG